MAFSYLKQNIQILLKDHEKGKLYNTYRHFQQYFSYIVVVS